MERFFQDRAEAGRLLGKRLKAKYGTKRNVLVLALPRGGVPVAAEVARELGAPLDVIIARKLGMPGQEEFAIGAIASGGFRSLNDEAISYFRIPASVVEEAAAREESELRRRELAYRGN